MFFSAMVLEKGSLILAHYTARVKDTGELVETTREEDAKKAGVYDPTKRYEPRLIALGERWVLEGLDEALQAANVGDKLTVELPPERAFGERDPNKVRLIPLRKFGDRAADLRVGEMVEMDDKIGIIRAIGSGRAQVDFNHRLAGKTIVYDVDIIKKLEEDRAIITALIKRRIPVDEEKLSFTIRAGELRVRLPSDVYLLEGIQITKRAVSSDIFKYVKGVKKVVFLEEYEAPQPKEAKEEEK